MAFDLSLYATYAGCFNTPDAFFVAGILHLIGHIKVPDQLQVLNSVYIIIYNGIRDLI